MIFSPQRAYFCHTCPFEGNIVLQRADRLPIGRNHHATRGRISSVHRSTQQEVMHDEHSSPAADP